MAQEHPIFSTLPAELYDSIFEELFRLDGMASIQCMRLVSRHFACLSSVLRFAFQKVTLPVSQEPSFDVMAIARHVKHISFQPIEYSWAMDLDTFRQILFIKPTQKVCQRYNEQWTRETGGRYLTNGAVSPPTFVKYYMDKRPPYTEEEVASRYNRYMSQVNKVKQVFENGDFVKYWTDIMRQMKGGIIIETRHWDFGRDHDHDFVWAGGDCAHTPEDCMKIHGVVGETLFDTVLKCITDAKIRVDCLNIYHCVQGRSPESFAWVYDGRLQNIDLQGLSFNPFRTRIIFHHRYNSLSYANNDPSESTFAEITSTLLCNTIARLRRLSLSVSQIRHCEYHSKCTHWPPCHGEITGIPIFEPIVSPTGSFPAGLRSVIRAARNLTSFTLNANLTSVAFNSSSSWRRFWRAIRYHPSRINLDIRVSLSYPYELHIVHYTGAESQSVPRTVQHSLEMYLSKMGAWDEFLEEYFETDRWGNYVGEEAIPDTDDEEMDYWGGQGGYDEGALY